MYNSLVKPKLLIFCLLSSLLVLDLGRFGLRIVPHFIIIVLATFLTDYLLIKVLKINSFFPLAALDTGLIIAFVLSPQSSLLFKLLIPLLAIGSKHFLKIRGRHLFNPAGFGLWLGAIFGADTSWLLTKSSFAFDLLLVVGAFWVLVRAKKWKIPISFFVSYWLCQLVLFGHVPFIISAPFGFSLLFLPLVMLPEPMTSPNTTWRQILYGALAYPLILIFTKTGLVLGDAFLQSLLFLNLIFFGGWPWPRWLK